MNIKLTNYIVVLAVLGLSLGSCEKDQDLVTANAKEGAFLSIEGSSGTIAGGIDPTVKVEESEVDVQLASLTYNIEVTAGAEDVEELVVVKSYQGQEVEVTRGDASSGVLVEYASVADFLQGFDGISVNDIRIGDVIMFQTNVHMKDGRVLVNRSAALGVAVSCLADLTGTYSVTNSACEPSFTVEITRNPNGSYHITSADGGFLHRCTSNATLLNAGNIKEQCGEILPSGDLDFGESSGYNIGNVSGGSWNAETGTLTMDHTQDFTANWPSEWSSTYVRQ